MISLDGSPCYKLQLTLSEDACRKLEQLQDLLAHRIPNGDPAALVERALDALLTQAHKRKTGITDNPRLADPRLADLAQATRLVPSPRFTARPAVFVENLRA